MPHTRSARKNLRKSLKRRLHNRSVKRNIKDTIKVFDEAVEGGKAEELTTAYRAAAKKLDKAAAKRVIHPNTAARKKSRLAQQLNAKSKPEAAKSKPEGAKK